ncbi:MAG: hypothetical protein OEV92_12540, partial [Nitrospinota bacterium]|nr:hypothetical protein [Nitrospinota bacterium]
LFGWITLGLALVSLFYVVRKRKSLQWPGELQHWRSAHVVVGLLFFVSLFLHSGGSMGAGVSLGVLAMSAAILLTGLWGIISQGMIPRRMTTTLQDPVYKSQLQDDINRIMREISEELEGRTPEFHFVYQRHILPAISITQPSLTQQRAFFHRYDPTSSDSNAAYHDLGQLSLLEQEVFYTMAEKALDILEIRRGQGYQRLLNQWLVWHIGLTSVIMAAILMHITASYYY